MSSMLLIAMWKANVPLTVVIIQMHFILYVNFIFSIFVFRLSFPSGDNNTI